MNLVQRYRLATICLTIFLLLTALGYATQAAHVITLRAQKSQMNRLNRQLEQLTRQQQEKIEQLQRRSTPADHAVYAFVLARVMKEPRWTPEGPKTTLL